MTPPTYRQAALILFSLVQVGCGGSNSSLNPAGDAAGQIANLFWWMAGGSLLIWIGVMALAIYAVRAREGVDRERQAKRIILAGAVTPAVVLAALLAYGLTILPGMIAAAPAGSLRVSVHGEQWWWRVHYEPPNGKPFDIANEIRLPVNEPVEFLLESDNVIHSFWIPSLGGKVDLIPGRVNRLVLRPTKTGTFRGMCAEFCGTAHAKMTFEAIVLPKAEFDLWLSKQAEASQGREAQ